MSDRLTQFTTLGESVYGSRWQTEAARALGLSDRQVRNYCSAKAEVPDEALERLREVARLRAGTILQLAGEPSGEREKGVSKSRKKPKGPVWKTLDGPALKKLADDHAAARPEGVHYSAWAAKSEKSTAEVRSRDTGTQFLLSGIGGHVLTVSSGDKRYEALDLRKSKDLDALLDYESCMLP